MAYFGGQAYDYVCCRCDSPIYLCGGIEGRWRGMMYFKCECGESDGRWVRELATGRETDFCVTADQIKSYNDTRGYPTVDDYFRVFFDKHVR